MATIKSYTDLEQSRKLAEFLPIESADMCYRYSVELNAKVHSPIPLPKNYVDKITYYYTPCWSLATLLDILQYPTLFQRADKKWGCTVWIDATKPYSISHKDNPLDACVAMIEKLHELNLL